MKSAAETLRILLDAGVPDSVGTAFRDAGHFVILHRDVLPDKSPDDVVCATALANNAILVAIDGDMKRMAKRYGAPSNPRFKDLNIIHLCCPEPLAAGRCEQAMLLIQQEWSYALKKSARRMWLDIGQHYIRTNR